MFRFVGKYLQVPTFCNTTSPATTLASQIAGGIERPQSASVDRSSGFLKINGLASSRAGW
jgi:hypothetical protein